MHLRNSIRRSTGLSVCQCIDLSVKHPWISIWTKQSQSRSRIISCNHVTIQSLSHHEDASLALWALLFVDRSISIRLHPLVQCPPGHQSISAPNDQCVCTLMTRRKQDFQRGPLVGVGFLTSLSLFITKKNIHQKICPGKFEKWLFLALNI